jgi:hypothetical protein
MMRLALVAALVGSWGCWTRTRTVTVEVPVIVPSPPLPCIVDPPPQPPEGITATECIGVGSLCFDRDSAILFVPWLEESIGYGIDGYTRCRVRVEMPPVPVPDPKGVPR